MSDAVREALRQAWEEGAAAEREHCALYLESEAEEISPITAQILRVKAGDIRAGKHIP